MKLRAVQPGDHTQGLGLYRQYAEFYRVPMSEQTSDTVWRWLHDPDHVLEGWVAEESGKLWGLAHFRTMPNPLRGVEVGFLDDLFVSPEARGKRVGEALIMQLKALAQERGWPKIRWITADDNYRARTLYDRVAQKTQWNVYEVQL